ncbi:hypothetical protein JL193_07165 [Polaribacter batillariae]|uniref:Uncharacterized protein n=1 Tax=Polaribacter batillariae TaxID=2808900 RepID=A0ABX7SZT6_9FLAO|nr:hypothetical protein [Polaribacter batillariae]QTD39021.1 hypothetical protein JL193_07165 [Polaribacter batillariae]
MAKNKKSEAALLEQWHVAIENSQQQTEIATQITNFGYDTAKIEEGRALLNATQTVWQNNQQEDQETTAAFNAFKAKREALFTLYNQHRKKAKAKFKRQPQTLVQLQITGTIPTIYISKIETIQHFYTQIVQNPSIKTELLSYNITEEELAQGQDLLTETQQARTHYLKEVGESQDATKQKDKALKTMENWMQDFYAMASIALENNPQLLEALGIFRKS